jgi:hypothetical protein
VDSLIVLGGSLKKDKDKEKEKRPMKKGVTFSAAVEVKSTIEKDTTEPEDEAEDSKADETKEGLGSIPQESNQSTKNIRRTLTNTRTFKDFNSSQVLILNDFSSYFIRQLNFSLTFMVFGSKRNFYIGKA